MKPHQGGQKEGANKPELLELGGGRKEAPKAAPSLVPLFSGLVHPVRCSSQEAHARLGQRDPIPGPEASLPFQCRTQQLLVRV